MYSDDERIRAVELYIELGKRIRPTIRQLGYPTKNALKGWYRTYQQQRDVPVGYAPEKNCGVSRTTLLRACTSGPEEI